MQWANKPSGHSEPGEEIHVTYGSYSNDFLLVECTYFYPFLPIPTYQHCCRLHPAMTADAKAKPTFSDGFLCTDNPADSTTLDEYFSSYMTRSTEQILREVDMHGLVDLLCIHLIYTTSPPMRCCVSLLSTSIRTNTVVAATTHSIPPLPRHSRPTSPKTAAAATPKPQLRLPNLAIAPRASSAPFCPT